MMRLLFVLLPLFLGGSDDPNRLPLEEAQRYARLCVEQALPLGDAQITTDVGAKKACATYGEGGGAMVLPDKKFFAKVLGKLGKDVTPVGQLWLRKWTLVVGGKAVPDEKLRIVTVKIDDKDRPMPLFLLGLRKGKKGPELVIYARENEPLAVLPLTKLKRDLELPLELQWSRGEKDVDGLTLSLAGEYEVKLGITRQVK
jgi:hypothetical protein